MTQDEVKKMLRNKERTRKQEKEFLEYIVSRDGRMGVACGPYCSSCPVYIEGKAPGFCSFYDALNTATRRLEQLLIEEILLSE